MREDRGGHGLCSRGRRERGEGAGDSETPEDRCAAAGPETAGRRRACSAGAGEGAVSGNGCCRDDGVRYGELSGGGDADWRTRLSDQAVCAGRADDGAGARGAEGALRPREPAASREAAVAEGHGRAGWKVAGDGEAVPDSVEGGVFDAPGTGPG